jgi:hypothetical protein
MASVNPKLVPLERQDGPQSPYGEVSGLSGDALLSLRVAERVSILSGDILHAAREGEAYETLVRMVEVMHDNLMSLSERSRCALSQHGFYRQGG